MIILDYEKYFKPWFKTTTIPTVLFNFDSRCNRLAFSIKKQSDTSNIKTKPKYCGDESYVDKLLI